MVSLLSSSVSQALDQTLFQYYPLATLVELAGQSCALAIFDKYHSSSSLSSILILVGPGNNGADGLVIARWLACFTFRVTVCEPKPSQSDLAQNLRDQLNLFNVPFIDHSSLDYSHYTLVVDALFGFSFSGTPRSPFDTIINTLATLSRTVPVVCIDVPSGWNVDEGPVSSNSIIPDSLVSLSVPKLCSKFIPSTCTHYLGGRFIPPQIAAKFILDLPEYPESQLFIKL
ncbi:hypothetical protein RCL1_006743 [Eukaryota sp. TZLM3-RCL]